VEIPVAIPGAPPRILITRAPHQASPLADALRAAGLAPLLIPTIELATPTTFAPLDAALADLSRFHWLLFTSANAVEAFAQRLAHQPSVILSEGGEAAESKDPEGASPATALEPIPTARFSADYARISPHCKVAAIGPATARALEAIGLTPTLIPPQAVAESLADALLPYAHPGTRFLLVRAEQARNLLPDCLRAAGAEVTIAPAYRTLIPTASAQQIRDLFHSPHTWPHAIAFTSGSTVTNLLALLESTGLTLPREIRRVSIGPVTSQTLREAGYPPQAEADEPTVSALAAAIVQSLIPNP
jgi:uroporphyrinogen-III synthase